ncbi:hypothetical protein ACOME3_000127 [Neoechinorhynchus agilis]
MGLVDDKEAIRPLDTIIISSRLDKLYANIKSIPQNSFNALLPKESLSVRQDALLTMPWSDRCEVIDRSIRRINRRVSMVQVTKGLLSAGPVKSLKYVSAKIYKRFAG